MKTILLASVAAAALAAPAWALPDRFEGQPGCIGASGAGCTQQATLEDDGNRAIEKNDTAVASRENVDASNADSADELRAALGRSADADAESDEEIDDEIGDTAEDIGDEAEDVGDDIADAASEFGDEVGDAADDVDDAFD